MKFFEAGHVVHLDIAIRGSTFGEATFSGFATEGAYLAGVSLLFAHTTSFLLFQKIPPATPNGCYRGNRESVSRASYPVDDSGATTSLWTAYVLWGILVSYLQPLLQGGESNSLFPHGL